MPETKEITTVTTLNVVGSSIEIETAYIDETLLNEILSIFIADSATTIDSIVFLQGEAGVTLAPGATTIVYIDSDGDLIISGPDAANYSLNEDGELIYTY